MRRSLVAAAVLLAAACVVAGPGSATAKQVHHRIVLTFNDRDLTESSGLVARGGLFLTVNDSGDGPYVYAVDRRTGDTAGVTTYSSDDVSDVEAIAPGGHGTVWVGDTGDNNADRPSVDVYRVPLAHSRGDRSVSAKKFTVVYPDGAHDAETLLAHPRTDRVYIVSKGILGGTVYAAPASLEQDRVNRLRKVGQVPGLVTDGAFFPDGEHVLLRSYGTAAVYTFPGLRPVGRFNLPKQEQGEGVAVDDRERVFLSSEGAYTDVLQVVLPAKVRAALGSDQPTALPSARATPDPEATSDRLSTEEGDGIWVAGGVLLVTIVGWFLFTVARRRGPHSG